MKTSILKKLLIVIMCFSFCMNSFAVVLSDNDGSAFITRPEYDSIKNDFIAKFNSFNTSIDAKIDNAIYSYLSAASPTSTQKVDAKNLISSIEEVWDKNILWTAKASFAPNLDTYNTPITNLSSFCLQTVIALCTRKAPSIQTRGYCNGGSGQDVFFYGYRVLKKEKGKITGNVLYRPLLTYNVSYFVVANDNTSFGSNMSSWSGLTHWGSTQKDTTTKYWVGYYNNQQYMADGTPSTSWAWRTASCSFTPTSTTQDFIMAPNSTTGVSVWDVDNESISTTADGGSINYGVYTSEVTGGTNPSSTVLTPSASNPLRSPDFTATLPWVSKNNVYNEQVLNLNGNSVGACKMKYGLPLAKADKDCVMKWSIDAVKGKIGWYLNDVKIFDEIPTEQTKTLDSDEVITGSIEMKKGDVLYVIYLPDGDDFVRLNVKELYYEYEA